MRVNFLWEKISICMSCDELIFRYFMNFWSINIIYIILHKEIIIELYNAETKDIYVYKKFYN